MLARTKWDDTKQSQLSRECRALLAQLPRACPSVVADRALAAGEVAGKIALDGRSFQGMFAASLGAKDTPQTVWSDGANELLCRRCQDIDRDNRWRLRRERGGVVP